MRGLIPRVVAVLLAMTTTLAGAAGASAENGDDPPGRPAAPGTVAIVPGAAWNDQNGELAQLHGAGILKVGHTYYAFGEDKVAGSAFTAVACYSSTDLVSWTRHADALSRQASGDLGPNRVVERPKVIYNATTHQYVMYMHIDSPNYGDARAGVATSATPCGPYDYRGSSRPLGQLSRDLGLFQDDDGTAYLLSEDRNNGLRVDKLSADYLSVESPAAVLPDRESPAMVKVDGTYYLFGSKLTGWNTNDNDYATAASPSGPWSDWKPFAPAGSKTFNSQTSFVLPVKGRHGTSYVFMGDRWYASHLHDSAPIWLPMSIGGGKASLNWQSSWRLDVADGTWEPQRTDTVYDAAADGTVSNGAQVVTCSACTGGTAVGGIGVGGGQTSYTYDDVDPALHYSGAWTHAANQGWTDGDYGNNESFSVQAGDSVTVGFKGTAVRWIGPKNTNGGIADVYLDDAKVATVDTYVAGGKSFQQALYAKSGLADGDHTLKIVVTGQKNAASTAATVVVDAIDLPSGNAPPPAGVLRIDHVVAPRYGDYTIKIAYVDPDPGNRYAYLTVNDDAPIKLAFPTTGTNTTNIAVARVRLKPGSGGNVLRFSNDDGAAPLIDTVAVPQPQPVG